MAHYITTDLGTIKMQDSLIANLAGIATMECYGVAGMAARGLQDGISAVLGHESLARGVSVRSADDGESLVIAVNIVIAYGVNIGEVGRNIREKVEYIVNQCTGIAISGVTVNVRGVKVTVIDD